MLLVAKKLNQHFQWFNFRVESKIFFCAENYTRTRIWTHDSLLLWISPYLPVFSRCFRAAAARSLLCILAVTCYPLKQLRKGVKMFSGYIPGMNPVKMFYFLTAAHSHRMTSLVHYNTIANHQCEPIAWQLRSKAYQWQTSETPPTLHPDIKTLMVFLSYFCLPRKLTCFRW